MTRSGFLTPSRFKDVMTVARGYKSKDDLFAELRTLADDQHKRKQKGSTNTKVYADGEQRMLELPNIIKTWSAASRFGDSAYTYAKEVALGRFGIVGEQIKAWSLDWGNRYEPEAREVFEAVTGLEFPKENFRAVSEVYPFIAGEADGQIYGKDKPWGGEIKCPSNPVNHLDNFLEAKQHDLYKWQVAGYCAPWMYGWDGYTFISYHPNFPGKGNIWFQDYERDQAIELELETTLLLFENEVVRPLVAKLENKFEINVEEKWRF